MADRPALAEDEIEITPAMIEAGAAELRDYDRRFDSPEDGAERIFLSMILAERPKGAKHRG